MSRRRGFAQVSKLRRTFRRLDPEITEAVKGTLEQTAKDIERDMLGGAPVDEGDLARSITYKIGRDGFTAVIGPSADTAVIKKGFGPVAAKFTRTGNLTASTVKNTKALWQLYKALWAEFGTKQGKPGSSAKRARPFIQPAFDLNKDKYIQRNREAVAEAITLAARG